MFHVLAKPIGPVCNLACEYCFYLEKMDFIQSDSKYRMTDETLELFVKKYIDETKHYSKQISFAWQGGEPTLLGIEFFRKALALQSKYAPEGTEIQNSIQTNGTLLNDDFCAFFKENKFLVGISVDGPPSIHNHYRKKANQANSYQAVSQGIKLLRKHKVMFNTLTTVNMFNVNKAKEVYNHLKEIGSDYLQFIPIVEVEGSDKQKNASIEGEEWGHFLVDIFKEWVDQKDYNTIWIQHFESTLSVLLGLPPTLCVYSLQCGNCIALEHDGSVYSCDHYVDPNHHIGNIRETSFHQALSSNTQNEFRHLKTDLSPSCQNCPHKVFCYGGCPKHHKDNHNVLCAGYKYFFNECLPTLNNMAKCLQAHQPKNPKGPQKIFSTSVDRNAPCPCGSNLKYKKCCHKKTMR